MVENSQILDTLQNFIDKGLTKTQYRILSYLLKNKSINHKNRTQRYEIIKDLKIDEGNLSRHICKLKNYHLIYEDAWSGATLRIDCLKS